MKKQNKIHSITKIMVLSFLLWAFLSFNLYAVETDSSDPNESSKYLDAVREFADNVIKYGRDTYGPKHTPLFVDGLNIHTHEPVEWISPEGKKWVLSNLASQQNLFRTLDGLSAITGDPKYRQAAMEAIEYAFENLRSPNGLFYWGHITAYDALGDSVRGNKSRQSWKLHYPHYDLMWKVNPESTKKLIEALWSAHILDWSNLDFCRHGSLNERLEEPWNHEYKGGPIFIKSKSEGALANILTGSSLIQAGTTLHRLSGQKQPLVWSKRLAKRFVDTRHPKTGISACIYNHPWLQLGEDLSEHFIDPYTTVFPWDLYEWRSLYYPENAQAHPWMSILLAGESLGEEGKEFTEWALEELTAWGKASYRKEDNSFVPMLTDGANLEGYVWEKGPGYSFGLNVIKPYFADPSFFWAYSVAYRITGDKFIWQMVRDIALGNNFGDIGQTPTEIPNLQTNTTCSHAYGVFGFLELYEKTKKPAYLEVSRRIGDNILTNLFTKGFFVLSKKHIYTRFDCFEPLALLHLIAAIEYELGSVPQAWPSCPLFVPAYRHKDQGIDRRDIYTLTEASEPPMSLQEAAAIGDIKLVKTLLDSGTNVESIDEDYLKTALHRAAISGHKDVVELLLAEGADVIAIDWFRSTPLHYAIEKGHKEISELLIARNADINAQNVSGDAPLHSAVRAGHKDVVELLIAKGADVNIRNNEGFAPLHVLAMQHRPSTPWWSIFTSREDPIREIAELLISKGADVNATDNEGRTPRWWAENNGHTGLTVLLREHEAKKTEIVKTPAKSKQKDTPEYKTSQKASKNTGLMDSDKPYVILERGDVRAVIVNNEPIDDEVLSGHRGGYSGVALLTHRAQDKNLFVPFYAGLNLEHIHDGTNQPRDILFEPRRAPMQIRQIDEYTAELYQPPTPNWQLESWLRYKLLEDGTIEMTLECIPHARTFKNDYIGLFFASYIDKPESLDIHFLGRPADDSDAEPRWIRGVTPDHGTLPTHLAIDDNRNFAHEPNFPLTLVFNRSNYRYTEPWYYGVNGGMALVLMFRPCDNVRLSQSPSGGGDGNPAWDFQWFVPQYKVGQRYRFVMRAMYLPFKSREQIILAAARHRAALE